MTEGKSKETERSEMEDQELALPPIVKFSIHEIIAR